jgi:hypothetical protein
MTVDAQELLKRARDLQIEALAALSTPVSADAKEYLFHTQEDYPYFVNRIGNIDVGADSEDIDLYTYQVIMRLVIGHMTSGYKGEPESNLQLYIPQVVNFFNSRQWLQTTSGDYDDAMTSLMEARITSVSGFSIYESAGISASQVGTEFVLTCLFEEEITQAFY